MCFKLMKVHLLERELYIYITEWKVQRLKNKKIKIGSV